MNILEGNYGKISFHQFQTTRKCIDMRLYKGDWRKHVNHLVIESCLSEFKNTPAGFSLDFGITDDGRTLLIEVNDGYALGSYGLFPTEYAKLISARWCEMTNTIDYCRF